MPMTGQTCCTEVFCLGQLSNLEQLEGPWLELMASGEPEAVATALRLFQSHLQWTIEKIGPTLVISEVELSESTLPLLP